MLIITTPAPTIESRNESALAMRVSGPARSVTTATAIRVEISELMPESFLAGWADYQAGRVVDMERALKDEPPPAV
jgi:hypothetical protein